MTYHESMGLETEMELRANPLLTADEADRLGWAVSDDEQFLSDVEQLIFVAVRRKVKHGKQEVRRVLQPALNDARSLFYRVAAPDTPSYLKDYQLANELRAFIDKLETTLEAAEARPREAKPKDKHVRDIVDRLLDLFARYDLPVTSYEKGEFTQALRVVFAAANRIKPGSMPKTTKTYVLEVEKKK